MGFLQKTLFQSMERRLRMQFTKARLKMTAGLLLSVSIGLLGLILANSWLVLLVLSHCLVFSFLFYFFLMHLLCIQVEFSCVCPFPPNFFQHPFKFIVTYSSCNKKSCVLGPYVSYLCVCFLIKDQDQFLNLRDR